MFTGLPSGGDYSLQAADAAAGCTPSPTGTTDLNFHAVTSSIVQNFAVGSTCADPTGVVPTGAGLEMGYAPHVFDRQFVYSEANRLVSNTTGADLPQFAPNGPWSSSVSTSFNLNGTIAQISGSYGVLVTNNLFDPTGAVVSATFGDAAQTTATFSYDGNETLAGYTVRRLSGAQANGAWTTYTANPPPPQTAYANTNTLQTTLIGLDIQSDLVGNPVVITDSAASTATEWPSGAQPVATRGLAYGDDYRLRSTSASCSGPTAPADAYVSPYLSEETDHSVLYPAQTPSERATSQSFAYDGRGNILNYSAADKDATDYYDQALGVVSYGTNGGVSGPDQLGAATPLGANGSPGISALYDFSGNMTDLFVTDSAVRSHYSYSWDEVGRLATADRSDNGTTEVVDQFAYDAQGNRVLRAQQIAPSADVEYTAQVFDSLVLKNASFHPGSTGDYERDARTEQVYLSAGSIGLAHAFWDTSNALPQASSGGGQLHIFLTIGGAAGSTAFVVDKATGELAERVAYNAYGTVDSDYRPDRWGAFREDVRYGGGWDEDEVGLVAMGYRYYAPRLGRFISPDPLTIHGAAGDLNPYEYAFGSPFRYSDPTGFDPPDTPGQTCLWFICWSTGGGGGGDGGVSVGTGNGGKNGNDGGTSGGDTKDAHNGPIVFGAPGVANNPFGTPGYYGPLAPNYISAPPAAWTTWNPYSAPILASVQNAEFVVATAAVAGAGVGTAVGAPAAFNTAVRGASIVNNVSLAQQGIVAGGIVASSALASNAAEGVTAAGTTVIGHYPAYLELAEQLGAKAFSIPAETWEAMTPAARWAANQQFLDAAIQSGDAFRLATPLSEMRAGSYFAQEVEYLMGRATCLARREPRWSLDPFQGSFQEVRDGCLSSTY